MVNRIWQPLSHELGLVISQIKIIFIPKIYTCDEWQFFQIITYNFIEWPSFTSIIANQGAKVSIFMFFLAAEKMIFQSKIEIINPIIKSHITYETNILVFCFKLYSSLMKSIKCMKITRYLVGNQCQFLVSCTPMSKEELEHINLTMKGHELKIITQKPNF